MYSFLNNIINYYNNHNNIANIIIGLIIFAIFFVIRNKLSKLILNIFGKALFRKSEVEAKRSLLTKSLYKPLATYIVLIGAYIGVCINMSNNTVLEVFKILTILIICWAAVNYLSNNLFLMFHFGEDADNKLNTTAIKFINNILKILIIAFAVIMVINELGYNVNGLITGLGVGGLAVSLAAQEAIQNLISGFIIVIEKPFIVGDFIQTSTIQGTVEEVTMRSTKIRTLEDSVVTVPNSVLTDAEIINLSKIEKRLIELDFGLTYSTDNDTIDKCINDIKEYLSTNEYIVDFPIRVYFSKIDDYSLNINVFCYTTKAEVNEYYEYLGIINLNIRKIIKNNNAEFAFPTNNVIIEK